MERFETLAEDFGLRQAADALTEAVDAISGAAERLRILEAALTQVASVDQTAEEVPEVSYSYIAIGLDDFFGAMNDLETALRADPDFHDPDLAHRRIRFLEAGCGSGRNLFLLGATDRYEIAQLRGFDISPLLVAHGHLVFGFSDEISVGDCMAHDYSAYDVVYFYRPFSDSAAQEAFEAYLVDRMRPGAYVIGCSNLSFMEDRRLIAKCENDRIYKKLR